MKAGHYCFPRGKYLKYSLHMEGKTAQKKQQWPPTSTWFHVSVKCCQSSTFSVPICSNFGHGPPVFHRQDPNVGCTLAACISFKSPVARCRCCARSQAPITAQKLAALGATFRARPQGAADWMVGQCGAMWSIYRIYSHRAISIYLPWWSMVCQAVSICFYPSNTLAWQILGQNFRIDTAALLNGIASKRAKACSHCAALWQQLSMAP